MRTLKKTLCLVLALVMVLGVCAFSASATDFNDDAKITYKEAVSVLNGIGVIQGKGGGIFAPEATLNRAEAAVILTKLMGGEGITAKSSFTDMAGFEWADSYVAFAEAQGVVYGTSATTYNPAGELTGAQWGAMLLRAAGFDDEELGFGAGNKSWEVGVAKALKDQGMYDRIKGFNPTLPISRDAACELAFQGMRKSPTGSAGWLVFNVNDPDEAPIFFADQLTAVLYLNSLDPTARPDYDIKAADPADSLKTTNFPGLTTSTGTDAFGRTTSSWIYNENNTGKAEDYVPVYSTASTARYTLTVNGLHTATIPNVANLAAYNANKSETAFLDGLSTALNLTGTKKLAPVLNEQNASAMSVLLNGEAFNTSSDEVNVSDEIEVFVNGSGKVTKVVIVRYTAVVIEKAEALTKTQIAGLEGTLAEGATSTTSFGSVAVYDKFNAAAGFEEGDYALVVVRQNYPASGVQGVTYNSVIAAKPVETVEGTVSQVSGTSLTLGGKVYAQSGISGTDIDNDLGTSYTSAAVSTEAWNATWILHLAQDGTYIAIEKKTTQADTSIVFAVAVYSKMTALASQYADGATLYYVQCVNLDGEIVSYQITSAAYGTGNGGNGTLAVPGLFKVTVAPGKDAGNRDVENVTYNYATLSPVTDAESVTDNSNTAAALKVTGSASTALTPGDASVSGTTGNAKFYTNASQKVFFLGDISQPENTKDGLKVNMKTGKTAIPASTNYVVYGTGNTTSQNYNIQAIFVTGNASTSSTGTGVMFGNELSNSTTTRPVKNTDGTTSDAYVHNVWIDGEAKEILTATEDKITGAWRYTVDDATGLYAKGAQYTDVASGEVKNNNGGMVDIGDKNKANHETDIDLNGVKLVNTLIPGSEAYNKCATTAAKLTSETITVVYSVNGVVWTPVVVYITGAPQA